MIYQISRDEESSDQCSQCQREREDGHSHAHDHEHPQDETSSEEEEVGVDSHSQPVKPQKSIIIMLQEEINQLKRSNLDKDKAIRDLRYELEARSKIQIQSMLAQKTASIKRIEKDPLVSPKGMIARLYSPQMKPKSRAQPESESALQIALLEKQVKELQLKMLQMTNKLAEYEQSFSWMQKFIVSFVQMAEDLSLTYGGKLNLKGLPLRKRTKVGWKYIKQLINYLMK